MSDLENGTTADPIALTHDQYNYIANVLYFWILGVLQSTICSIGLVANLLSIATLWKKRTLVTYKIFIGMAVADLVTVCILLSFALRFMVYRPIYTWAMVDEPPNLKVSFGAYFWYNTFFLFQNTFMCISNWCIVLLAIFRLIVIVFPLNAAEYASPLRVNFAIGSVYIGTALAQIPGYMTKKWVNGIILDVMPRNFLWIFMVNNILPVTISTVLTVTIIVVLKRRQIKLRGSMEQEQVVAREREHRQLTITLLLITLLFILSNTPDLTYWIMDHSGYFKRKKVTQYSMALFYTATSVITWINYSCNFFVYILSNASFRKDFRLVVTGFMRCLTGKGVTIDSSHSHSTGTSSLSDNKHHQLKPVVPSSQSATEQHP